MQAAPLAGQRDAPGPLPAGAVREHQASLLGALWSAEQVAQRAVAAELAQPGALRPRLDALGHDADAVRMCQLDDGRHDAVAFEVRPDAADEGLVELHG